MKCPYCNIIHSDTALFCEQTGNPLTQTCPNPQCKHKGKPLPLDVDYCPYCGSYLKNTANRKESEEVKITQPSSQGVNEKVEVKIDDSFKQETTNNQQHPDRASHTKINGISDFNEEYGCWSKGWKIAVGIFSFLFGLHFWYFVFKSCS